MTDVQFRFRKGAGSNLDVLFGTVTLKPTLAHSRGTSMVLPAPSTWDIINGEVLATNVQPTPEPVEGVLEWGYEVTVKDRHGKSYSFLVGVPDSTSTVEFVSLPRYFETKPPLFGQGPKGDAGETATISVGTVTSGTEASVTNSGTSNDAKLDFVLPKGDKGDRGDGVPDGGTALQYIRKDSSGAITEWVSPETAIATGDKAGFLSAEDKKKLDSASSSPTKNTLVVRDSAGRFQLPLPSRNPLDAVNRDYVDSTVSSEISAAKRVLVTLERAEVNVRDFGAVGDGTTDDSQAFRDALQKINSLGGGTLVARPGGIFNLGSQVRVYSNTTIDLEFSEVRRTAGSGYVAFCTISGGAKGYGSGGKNIIIRRVRFKGDFATGRTLNNVFHHADNLLIEDCTFTEAVTNGHSIDLGGCSNVTVRRCVFRGRYEVEGRAYVEAIQIDHSTRSGAGGELAEDSNAWDGLPCENITVEDCISEPLKVGSVTYLAPRLVGAHSRVANIRHKNITIKNVVITDSGSTEADQNYRGWIHFIHAENVLIDGYTAVNTRNESAIVLGFGNVSTTYPLSSVANSSPTLDSTSGPIACRDILVKNLRVYGRSQTVDHPLIVLSGREGALTQRVKLEAHAKGLHSGDSNEFNSGATLVEANYLSQAAISLNGNTLRRLASVENTFNVKFTLTGEKLAHSAIRLVNCQDISLVGMLLTEASTAGYFNNVKRAAISGNQVTSNDATNVAYNNMYSFTGCEDIQFNNNSGVKSSGSGLVAYCAIYGNTKSSVSFNNMSRGFTEGVVANPNSTVALANNMDY